jgi:hypothetical protein
VPAFFWAGTEQLIADGALAEAMRWSADATNDILDLIAKDRILQFHLVSIELWLQMAFGGKTPEALGEKLAALAIPVTPRLPQTRPPRRLMSRLWRH